MELFFTSLNIKLLDSNLFRKIQIYLINRNDYDFELYSINEFKITSEK